MLDSLHHLILIDELGTFTTAARRAHLTQPALTASIQRLEQAMAAPLLLRHARGATPTAAGQALLPHARAALGAVSAGRQAVAEVMGLQRGRVRVGGGSTACTYLLPPILSAFHAAWPGVDLRVRELLTPQTRDAVRSGLLDLGIAEAAPPGSTQHSDLVEEAWRLDPICLVTAPSLRASLRWDGPRLAPGTPAVTFVQGSALRALLDHNLPDLDAVVELGSIAAVKGHTRAGLGVTLLSRTSVQTDLELGRLVEIDDPRVPWARQLVLVHGGLQRLSPAALALREALRETPGESRP